MTQPPQGTPDPNWQPGQPPQQYSRPQLGYPQYGYPQQPPPKKKAGCMKVGLIVLGVLVLLVIIIAAVSSGDGDSPTVTPGDNNPQGADQGEPGVDFQGKTDKDTSANAGDTITKDGVATTSTPLTAETTVLDAPIMCTTITIKNDGDKPVHFNSIDWKMQDPNGASRMTTYGGDRAELSFGDLAPGGQVAGDICFDGDPATQPGQYVVLNDGFISFSSDRLAWVNSF